MQQQITVSQAIAKTLHRLGAAHIFGVVGSGNCHVTNELVALGVGFTAARHEMGSTCMADAYSRATGKVSIVTVHQGCGLTNALTGIGEAAKARTPIVVISGDTPPTQKNSNFWIEQDDAVRSVGAVAERIHSAASAVADAARAFSTALLHRRTVVLSMPIDLQKELIDFDEDLIPALVEHTVPAASDGAVSKLADLLRAAERPVFVGGRGAWGAITPIRELAEASSALSDDLRCRPWTVCRGSLAHGCDGRVCNRRSHRTNQGRGPCRVIRGRPQPVDNSLGRPAARRENSARGRHAGGDWLPHRTDLGVIGDSAQVAAAALEKLREAPRSGGYRNDEVAKRLIESRHWSEQAFEDRGGEGKIDPQALSQYRWIKCFRWSGSWCPTGGNFNAYPAMLFKVPDHLGYCVPLAFQSIGLSLASGIGAGVALPDRMPVVRYWGWRIHDEPG